MAKEDTADKQDTDVQENTEQELGGAIQDETTSAIQEPDVPLNKNPEVLTMLEAARKEEKSKLYKTIEGLKNQIADLKNVKDDLSSQMEEVREELDTKKNDSLTEQEVQRKEFNKSLERQNKTIDKLEGKLGEFQTQVRVKELELYKYQKVQEAGSDIVASMVNGDTEEAIDASVERAKEEYQRIADQITSDVASKRKKVKTTTTASAPVVPEQEEPIIPDTSALSDEEYKEQRQGILQKIGQRFAEATQ
tara:strand:- start:3605 stop:4354 length:750 start_codon:yes stop_codon:yes gene_type:complete